MTEPGLMSLPCVPLLVLWLALGCCRGVELPFFSLNGQPKGEEMHTAHLCPGALQFLCCWAACLKWSYFKREAVKLDHVKLMLKKTFINQV